MPMPKLLLEDVEDDPELYLRVAAEDPDELDREDEEDDKHFECFVISNLI